MKNMDLAVMETNRALKTQIELLVDEIEFLKAQVSLLEYELLDYSARYEETE